MSELGESKAVTEPGWFVPGCCYQPETNGLGRTQRRIVAYLGTAPAGFGGCLTTCLDGTVAEHGEPYGVTVREIACAVYERDDPTAAQTRAVQRAVRRLETLGLVACWHGRIDMRTYVTPLGFRAAQAVPGLYVALADWDCEHVRAYRAATEEARRQRERREEALMAAIERDPIAALRGELET